MQPTAKRILDLMDQPEALEALYRGDPEAFRGALPEAVVGAPDSATLHTWRARLEYREPTDRTARSRSTRRAWQALAIGIGVGALVRVPALWLDEEWYYPRMAPSLAMLALALYFWLEHRDRRALLSGAVLAALATVLVALLPDYTDSVVMALMHLPILFWALLGFVFTGRGWRESEPRIRFVRYNGELLILGSLVALGGIVFSGLTIALFGLMADDSEVVAQWYVQNVGIVGAAAVPLAATYLYDVVFRRHTGIASVLARVFAPLFLVMTAAYLGVAFLGGQNPFLDREFLITVNGLLLVVLGMTVLSIAERGDQADVEWIDWINVALLFVTLVIDLIALAAIVFRLTSYGLTPNRVVVLGANLVIMTHLAWTCRAYVGRLRGTRSAADVRGAVAGYLPVYAAWAALVVFVLPFVFRFA
jgi:hypothetical protein